MSSQQSRQKRSHAPNRPVPLLDVGRGNGPLREEIIAAVTRVCDSGQFVFGPDCQQLESSLAELCQTEFAIGCASGSDALLLALMACGVGSGDEVIVPSFTFFATASAAWRLGAKPVFVDIEPATFNLNAELVEAAITSATKAIIPVHLYGQCADMEAICDIARRYGLYVIEDAAQAIGAKHRGQTAGSIGHVGCFSFYPTKNLGGFGDGGMLTTSDRDLADKLRLLAAHGMKPRYHHSVVGINSRLDSIQAAVLNIKLQHLPQWTTARQQHAARYQRLFAKAGLSDAIETPQADASSEHVWNQYTIRVAKGHRDALRKHLNDAGIGCEIYYPIPLHMQECFRALDYAVGSLPETERAAAEVLSLPVFPELTADEQDRVIEAITGFVAESAASESATTSQIRMAS